MGPNDGCARPVSQRIPPVARARNWRLAPWPPPSPAIEACGSRCSGPSDGCLRGVIGRSSVRRVPMPGVSPGSLRALTVEPHHTNVVSQQPRGGTSMGRVKTIHPALTGPGRPRAMCSGAEDMSLGDAASRRELPVGLRSGGLRAGDRSRRHCDAPATPGHSRCGWGREDEQETCLSTRADFHERSLT
jgi:hypothetical protein